MKVAPEEWIVEADIRMMQSAMEAGTLNAVQLVQLYVERIRKYDGPINSILELNPDALEIAFSLDEERRRSGSRGLLHGIPILLKDNIDTRDRMHTSAGSVALANSIAPADAFVAAKLREAGAVLLGKANMTEWANAMSDTMWAGYSSRGGIVLNPYGPGNVFVGGSSSGSAAAVAASFCAASIGTETSGSIVCPASYNFAVGIKPTVGLVSRSGIIPLSRSQDTAGPIARTVTDAAILLGAITGEDEQDEATLHAKQRVYEDYTPFLDARFIRQARIGIPRYYCEQLDEAALTILESAIAVLRSLGATIVDPVELPCAGIEWDRNMIRHEFKKDLNDYLARLLPEVPVRTMKELIAYNEANAEAALRYGQGGLERCEETSGSLLEPVYLQALRHNRTMSREQGIDYALQAHRLDALLFQGHHGSEIAARAGYPLVTVPGGYASNGSVSKAGYVTDGPYGITFSGTAYSEPTLIKLAYAFEQATKHRFPPSLSASLQNKRFEELAPLYEI
ncbi:Amidase [Paenibacillus curdlanolyticus YK9]|uniref:Amidase n=1 Tax=Paenibacillus curdlanolyticus YK9 TaxID=717606 RepID=E0I6N0_9BACL|nr:amidase family protein [Paenibacillus curdlanolyticus]EFM11696.1 Amidase [Paenibacillus curdlanolyticus YK9]